MRPRQWKASPPGRCPCSIQGSQGDIRVQDMVDGTLGASVARTEAGAKDWKSSRVACSWLIGPGFMGDPLIR